MKSTREPSKKRKAPAEGSEKRQRVSLACEYCRSRKQRCDSGRPSCSACRTAGQQCQYDEKVRRRGLVPGYVRVLECLFGALFSRSDGAEDAMINLLTDGAIWPAENPEEGSDQGGDTNALFQRWKKSKVCQVIESKLNDNEVSIDATTPVPTWFEQDIGRLAVRTPDAGALRDRGLSQLRSDPKTATVPVISTYEQDFSRTTSRTPVVGTLRDRGPSQFPYDPKTIKSLATPDVEQDPYRVPSRANTIQDSRASARQSVHVDLREALTNCTGWERAAAIADSSIALVLPLNSWRLFDIFFTFTSCWLPLVERRHIFKIAESYQGNEKLYLKSRLERSSHSVLWAVMAYASFQDRSSRKNHTDTEEGALTPEQLLAIASSLITEPFEVASLEQAQALVLLSLINCGRGEFIRAWQQVGGAASSIRCLPDVGSSPNSKAIKSCCYLVDALVSARCGSRPHFAGENAPHIDVDGVEEYERWTNRTDICGEANVQIPRAIPQRLYSTFNTLLDLIPVLHSSQEHYDAARWLSDWYTNFCTSNRQALSSSGIFSSPGLAHTMMVYHFLHCRLVSDSHAADMLNIAASWDGVFGHATLPPTFALLLEDSYAATCRAVFTSPHDEKGTFLSKAISQDTSPHQLHFSLPFVVRTTQLVSLRMRGSGVIMCKS